MNHPRFSPATIKGICGDGEVCLSIEHSTGVSRVRFNPKEARFMAEAILSWLDRKGMTDRYSQSEIDSGRQDGKSYVFGCQSDIASPTIDYYGDDYDRCGCTSAVEVLKDGYRLSINDPSGRRIETYYIARTIDEVIAMMRDWMEGRAPRRKRCQSALDSSTE